MAESPVIVIVAVFVEDLAELLLLLHVVFSQTRIVPVLAFPIVTLNACQYPNLVFFVIVLVQVTVA